MLLKAGGLLLLTIFALDAPICRATSEILVMGNKGDVWVVSDTLMTHDGLPEYVCKVVMQKGRLIFNAGLFDSAADLEDAERSIPVEDYGATAIAIAGELLKHCMVGYCPTLGPRINWQSAGTVQVDQGTYWYEEVDSSLNPGNPTGHVTRHLTPGIPDGFGIHENNGGDDVIKKLHDDAEHDPNLRKRFAENPRTELLKVLEDESQHDSSVGKPFTILLLHKNGTVSDYSRVHICKIPNDARYRTSRSRRVGPTDARR